MYASIRKLEDVRVCMQQVSSMTNELKVSRWLHMYMHVQTRIPPKVIYLIKKLHMDDAVCGAIGIDKKISSTVHVR